jgi:glycosyltransferase involved in cell wall biosynthesis
MTEFSPKAELAARQPIIDLVSVVITCYNQGRFLNEAIESVLRQSWPSIEIIVIDDGSTDDTAEVSHRHHRVHYFSQSNQGLSAARNRGIREGHGKFLAFLDADDRLRPEAIEAGVAVLAEHPDCAFAFGDFRYIQSDGTVALEPKRQPTNKGYYPALLRGNFIGMHATVIYRREVFETIGVFDTSLNACEDYEFYLRVSRQLPICHHGTQVAEYRRHDSNMSCDSGLILRSVLSVLHSQKKYIEHNRNYKRDYKHGVWSFAGEYGEQLVHQSWSQLRVSNQRRRALQNLFLLFRYYPMGGLRCFASIVSRRLRGFTLIH